MLDLETFALDSSQRFPHQFKLLPTQDLVADSVAELLEQRLLQRLRKTCAKPLGLATGRTMQPIYNRLTARLRSWPSGELDRLRQTWLSFNLDEYVGLDRSDQSSFAAFMHKHLVRPLALPPKKVLIPDGGLADRELEAQDYVRKLQRAGGIGVQLLGLGANGHIGFNEPPCSADAACRVVDLSESTRQQNADSFQGDPSQVPRQAITLGLKEILEAEEIHLVVTGTSKANILKALLQSSSSDHLPASWLRRHHNVWLWTDPQAIKLLALDNS